MITQHAWMFLSSYEKLREKLVSKNFVNMAHLGARAFDEIGGEVVQTTTFVHENTHEADYSGVYVRLVDIAGEHEKEMVFLNGENRYTAKQENFSKIPGSPVAYWVSENFIKNFSNTMQKKLECKTGLICGNNDKYIKYWFEILFNKINKNINSLEDTQLVIEKWFPYNHGGEKRKWFGGHLEVVNLENNAYKMRQEPNSMLRNSTFYFKKGITWNRVGSGTKFAARLALKGFVFDDVSPSGFTNEDSLYDVLAYMNSIVFNSYLRLFCTALKTEIGHIQKVPFINTTNDNYKISILAE